MLRKQQKVLEINPILLNLFQGIDSSTAGFFQGFFDNNIKTTQAKIFEISLHGRAFIYLSI